MTPYIRFSAASIANGYKLSVTAKNGEVTLPPSGNLHNILDAINANQISVVGVYLGEAEIGAITFNPYLTGINQVVDMAALGDARADHWLERFMDSLIDCELEEREG